MEYKKKCNVCGKIFCYTDEDLRKNLSNASLSALESIGSLASTLGAGTIFHTQYLTNESNRHSDKIVDYNRCPYCNSTDLDFYFGETPQADTATSVASVPSPKAVNINSSASTESLLKRVFLFLEDGDWDSAEAYCEACLDKNPELAEAYLGKLMVEKKLHTVEEFSSTKVNISDSKNYKKAIRYGSEDFVRQLQSLCENAEKSLKYLTAVRERLNNPDCSVMVDVMDGHLVALCADGSIQSCNNRDGIYDAEEWHNLVSVAIGYENTLGLREDGTVIACGQNSTLNDSVSKWKDIKEIRIAGRFAVGLRMDGTVVACGNNAYKPEDRRIWEAMIRDVSKWKGVVSVKATTNAVIGLCSDGTVKYSGQYVDDYSSIADLRNVTKIKALKAAVAAFYQNGNVDLIGGKTVHLKNIVDVGPGSQRLCLKCDGTAFISGDSVFKGTSMEYHVDDWKEIISIDSDVHAVGLTGSGSVVATGGNERGQCDVYDWQNIVAIKTHGNLTFGICADGTVLCCGDSPAGKVDTSGLRLFHDLSDLDVCIARNKAGRTALEKAAEERRIAEEKAAEERRKARVSELQSKKLELENELSGIKGIFSSFKKKKLEEQITAVDAELAELNT